MRRLRFRSAPGLLVLCFSVLLCACAGELRAAERSRKTPAELAAQLGTGELEHRREAAYQLDRLGAAALPALPALLKALEDPDKQVWSWSISTIAALGPAAKEAIPVLVQEMDQRNVRGNRDRERRQSLMRTAFALSQIGAEAVPALREALKSGDNSQRIGAARALGGMGAAARAAIPELVECLGGSEDLRNEAADALALIGPDAIAPLTQIVGAGSGGSGGSRIGAARALAQFGRPAAPAIEPLTQTATVGESPAVRAAALGALCRIAEPSPSVLDIVLHALQSGDGALKHAAINALASSRELSRLAMPRLIVDLQTGSPAQAEAAARVLSRLGSLGAEAVPALVVRAWKEPQQEAYSSALAGIGEPALEALAAELATAERGNTAGREWVFRALGEIGPIAGPALARALKSPTPSVRAGAARALADLPLDTQPEAIKSLWKLTKEGEAETRAAAFRALATVRDQRAKLIPVLEKSLQDPSPEVRKAAAGGLATSGAAGKLGVAGLADLLHESDPMLQRSAVLALSGFGAEAAPALPVLLERLSDPALRASVIEVLGKIGPAAEPAVPKILEFARSKDEDLQVICLQALGSIGRNLEQTLPILYEGLQKSRRDLRELSMRGIAKVEPDRAKAFDVVAKGLTDESGRYRRGALEMMKLFPDRGEEVIGKVLHLIENQSEKKTALNALRDMRPRDPAVWLNALQHKDAEVRVVACAALGELGPAASSALPVLEQKAQGDEEPVRKAAKKAAARIAGNSAPNAPQPAS